MVNWRPRCARGRIGLLTAVALMVALVAAPIANWIFGRSGILAVGIACVSCLLPGSVLFVLARRWTQGSAQLNLMLAGMALRGVCCVLAGVAMEFPLQIPRNNYLIWLCVFYFPMLACETSLILQKDPAEPSPSGVPANNPIESTKTP